MKFAASPDLALCTADTGFSLETIPTMTVDKMINVCKTMPCMKLMDELAAAKLGNCTVPGTNVSIQQDVLGKFATACQETDSMSSTGSMGSAGSMGSMNGSVPLVDDESKADIADEEQSSERSPPSSSTSGAESLKVKFASAIVLLVVILA
ncbi:hypothetical protein CCR75_002533 [Bremia lactucae]|uniref:Elicitin n=1 Tax=Bremia lactucae TaxID=4779 RepID=A0A976IJ61_BRELC|nr:hypothetical protein CCR75_002533 [Bremia lactucae]